jgi:hypothetical protein
MANNFAKAIRELESERERIDAALRVLRSIGGGGAASSGSYTPRKRNISEAGRKRIAEAQRRRWAKVRAGK